MDEGEDGRPLVRCGGGFEDGFVELERVIEVFQKEWEIVFNF